MATFILLVLLVCITSFTILWFFFPAKLLVWTFQAQQKQRMQLLLGSSIELPDSSSIILFQQNTLINAVLLRQATKLPITIVLPHLDCTKSVLKLLWQNRINIITPKEVYSWNEQSLLLMTYEDYKHYKKTNATVILGYTCGNVNLHHQGRKRLIPQYFQLHLKQYQNDPALSITQALKRLETASWFEFIDKQPPLICQWISQAKMGGGALSVADSTGVQLNHHRLLAGVLSFTEHLRPILAENDTIGVCLPASVGTVITTLSLLFLKKTMVNLNYTANKTSLLSAISQSNLKIVLTSYRFIDQLKGKGFDIKDVFQNNKLIYLEDIKKNISKSTLCKNLLLSKLLPARLIIRHLNIHTITPKKPMFILFSSGSEGSPKGVQLSHQNILGNIKQATAVLMEVEHDGVLMSTLPIFHAFGLMATLLLPLVEGMPFICHPDPRDTVAIGHLVKQYQATVMFGTSTFFRLYAKSRGLTPEMLASLRLIVTGAERLLPEVRILFETKFNKPICEGYGTTELSPATSSNIAHKPENAPNKLGTVGRPLPGCEIRIVHPETLEELACGEPGLILVGGVNVMMGYLKNEQKTNKVLVEHDGINWYKTGDKGFVDTEGYLTILGRYARFAKLGGEMVSLYTIEKQITDVINNNEIMLLATSITSVKKGESIVLLFTGPITVDELKHYVAKSAINNLMKPQHYLKIESIPTLGTGKIDFAAAKKTAETEFTIEARKTELDNTTL